MELLQGQMSAFDFVDDIKIGEVKKENKFIKKKKSIRKSYEVENQASIFDLDQESKEKIEVNFTTEQLQTIEILKKEREWIEYSLYKNGAVVFITKEDRIKVIPQEDISKAFYIKDRYRSYFIKKNGEIDVIGIGITRWKNPVRTIVKEE